MYIKQTHSTNELIKEQYLSEDSFFAIRAGFQTSGKGQQGNHWEAQADQNLLGSILIKNPPIAVHNQFILTMITSVAILDAVNIDGICIKWPNDIYFNHKKLGGILIENNLCGSMIQYAIIGIGLNVNQTTWSTNIPNPTSIHNITGHTYDIDGLWQMVQKKIQTHIQHPNFPAIKKQYMLHLYRKEGYHLYAMREDNISPNNPIFSSAAQHTFEAKIVDVTEAGQLILQDEKDALHTFHFKQISYILPH